MLSDYDFLIKSETHSRLVLIRILGFKMYMYVVYAITFIAIRLCVLAKIKIYAVAT